jgi:hypothetical protein
VPSLRRDGRHHRAGAAAGLDDPVGVRGWTYPCANCTRSNLRSIEPRLFDRDILGFGTAN